MDDTPISDPLLGQIVDGRYRALSVLAEGGMGRLFEVEHVELGSRHVLKTVLESYVDYPGVAERLVREAKAASQIGGSHVVSVTDSGMLEDGRFYYVMEKLEGQDLEELLLEEPQLAEPEALRIVEQVLRGLEAAHAVGVVHRDLKPANIVLTEDVHGRRVVKVVDFGIAAVEDAAAKLTRAGELLGTPQYMSPEQCRGEKVDGRSDLYALGIVLLEMLSGECPLEELEPMQVVARRLDGEMPDLASIEDTVSEPTLALLRALLAADKDERVASPADALAMLEAREEAPRRPAVRTLPLIEQTQELPAPVPMRRASRWQARALLVAASTLLGVGVAAWGVVPGSAAARPALKTPAIVAGAAVPDLVLPSVEAEALPVGVAEPALEAPPEPEAPVEAEPELAEVATPVARPRAHRAERPAPAVDAPAEASDVELAPETAESTETTEAVDPAASETEAAEPAETPEPPATEDLPIDQSGLFNPWG